MRAMTGLQNIWRQLRPALQRRTTYDKSHPWLLYHYRTPDALAWALGFSVIQTECLICGAREWGVLRVWCADPEVGKQKRLRIVEQHRHGRLRWQPLYWRHPMGNYGGWREWQEEQHHRN